MAVEGRRADRHTPPVRKREKILIGAGCLLAIAGLFAVLGGADEPQHDGRTLSSWLAIYYESDRPNQDRAQRLAAAEAIRAIGTNGLPQLLESIRYEAPSWYRPLARVLPRRIGNSRPARAKLYRAYHRAEAAQMGLDLLGTNAVSAIPELTSLMRDKSRPETAMRAIQVLGYLGPAAFPLMEAGLADASQPFREIIASCVGTTMAQRLGTNTCLPPLRKAMEDADPKVRVAAISMVQRLAGGRSD